MFGNLITLLHCVTGARQNVADMAEAQKYARSLDSPI
jgi:hypothetical protein